MQYDPATSIAKVDFEYNQDIDLTKKEIKFVSSQSVAQNEKYFYDSPSTVITLSSPTNLLLTTYATS